MQLCAKPLCVPVGDFPPLFSVPWSLFWWRGYCSCLDRRLWQTHCLGRTLSRSHTTPANVKNGSGELRTLSLVFRKWHDTYEHTCVIITVHAVRIKDPWFKMYGRESNSMILSSLLLSVSMSASECAYECLFEGEQIHLSPPQHLIALCWYTVALL